MTLPAERIHSRANWGANPPRSAPTSLGRGSIEELVFHYSGSDAERRSSHALCDDTVRSIQNFHQRTRGWNDIAYNKLACHHGHVYDGRGWGVMSAATFGANGRTQAICFLGGDTARDDVTAAGREALAFLANDYFAWREKSTAVGGHRDFVRTSCPGDEIMAWIAVKGWLVDNPADPERPWPIPIPAWYWVWAKWQRERFLYPTRAKWMQKRPGSAPKRVPDWAWVRLAAMTPKSL